MIKNSCEFLLVSPCRAEVSHGQARDWSGVPQLDPCQAPAEGRCPLTDCMCYHSITSSSCLINTHTCRCSESTRVFVLNKVISIDVYNRVTLCGSHLPIMAICMGPNVHNGNAQGSMIPWFEGDRLL